MEQADRDAKRDKEQADRDAKREEELKQWREGQDNILRLLVDRDQRNPQAVLTADAADTHVTPKRPRASSASQSQLQQNGSRVLSTFATPSTNMTQPAQFTKADYCKLSKAYKSISYKSKFPEVLDMLNNGWHNSWGNFASGKTRGQYASANKILQGYASKCANIWSKLAADRVSEDTYQSAFGYLASAIESCLPKNPKPLPRLYWKDTHTTPMKRLSGVSRKPDGGFFTHDSEILNWTDLAVVVEVKSDDMRNDHDHIRGQLVQDFIDMATILPRRFMIGLTLASRGVIDVHFCLPSGIYTAHLGSLPLTGPNKPKSNTARLSARSIKWTEDEMRVVMFISFLYCQSHSDCGYLTGRNSDYPWTFSLKDILGATKDKSDKSPLSKIISLEYREDGSGVLGRHKYLKGQRTWVYLAKYDGGNNRAFFKFQWVFDGESEIDIHRFVLKRRVPNVPKVFCGASIGGGGSSAENQKYVGQAIVMEEVGDTIRSAFGKRQLVKSDAEIIDLFAGYVHTLIAAAMIDRDHKFVLHRDISTGNLTFRGNHPYIIDWGYGRVCTENETRTLTGKELIGTTIYMGIRVLKGHRTRSVVDDLESLFLVLCHCLWRSIGAESDDYDILWSSEDLKIISGMRIAWLHSEIAFSNQMGIPKDQHRALQHLVKGMYGLLFPAGFMDICNTPKKDPRIDSFEASKWVEIFEDSREYMQTPGAEMPCLAQLREYVYSASGRRISFITQSPPLEQDGKIPKNTLRPLSSDSLETPADASYNQTPTRKGSKRQSNDLSISSSLKKSRNHE
ncbi:hypothetical protein H4R20_004643 [Coemansia guatemalensis]|uniref:Fungal-type protein kinase domain-containing protein n=1 Tax=Coemansia guatemalensis TaxID=2761395 RepID=A0A9W8HU78_9FUNG|nr:hypothetical protein H4R20_004643 [Coemansia guatemalensis]